MHPGGPFWSHKDDGAWSIPKGLLEPGEPALAAAIREFNEETGFVVSEGFIALGELTQPSKKIVHAWAVKTDFDSTLLRSNTFELEWPKHSGNIRAYPEVDRGDWFSLDGADRKIFPGQAGFLRRLTDYLATQNDQ